LFNKLISIVAGHNIHAAPATVSTTFLINKIKIVEDNAAPAPARKKNAAHCDSGSTTLPFIFIPFFLWPKFMTTIREVTRIS
jgi:hypothetical protein